MFVLVAALALAPETAAKPATQEDPIVCRRDTEAQVGTHLRPKKRCLPKSDWKYVEKQSQSELQGLHDKHLSPGTTGYRRGRPQ